MSWLNDRLERPLRRVQADPFYRPVVDAILGAQKDGVSSSAVADVALRATRDQYVRSGREMDTEDIRYDAYLAASAAALERPYQLSDTPPGTDKAQHFFVSGTIAAGTDRTLDYLRIVPAFIRRGLGIGLSITLGFFKEVADLFSTGFSRQDLQADWAGARSPFARPVPAGGA